MGYLDSAGLSHFTAWVKARLSGKQDALTPDGSIKLQGGDIAVSLPTKAVSKAEYEALTDAEKQAEVLYAVTDDAGGSGGGEVYSTEETRIGTWVDGKPIYRKVFSGTSGGSGTSIQFGTVDSLSELVYMYGKIYHAGIKGYVSIAETNVELQQIGNALHMYIGNVVLANQLFTVIAEYTKTTD